MAKFFVNPFAVDGDVATIPDTAAGNSGPVSYQYGFTPNYEAVLGTDPSALPIPRTQFNQLMLDITNAVRQYQAFGVYDFITTSENDGTPFPYGIYARVRYDDGSGSGIQIYESLVTANTAVPSTGGVATAGAWRNISSSSIPIGTMFDYAGPIITGTTPPPASYLACDASAVSRTTYAALFAVIGVTYGAGDGSTTFNLPDFRGRYSMGFGGPAIEGTSGIEAALGSQGGAASHQMTENELVNHGHSGQGTISGDTGNTGGNLNPTLNASDGGKTSASIGMTVAATGSSVPFNIIPPSLVVNKIIRYI